MNKDWKTTVFGTLATTCISLAALQTPYTVYFAAAGIVFGAIFSIFSKDAKLSDDFRSEEDDNSLVGTRPGGR